MEIEIDTMSTDYKSASTSVIDMSYLAYYIHKLKRRKAARVDEVVGVVWWLFTFACF